MRLAAERQQVADTCRRLAAARLVVGTAGNVSVRVGDLVAISPSGLGYEEMAAVDVPVVDLDGNRLEGEFAPSSELPLHLALYHSSSHQAIVHTHAEASTALGLVVDEVPTSHYYTALYGGPIRVAPYATFGSAALAEHVREAMVERKAALMSNHGAVVASSSLESCYDLTSYLEYVCEIQLRAMSTGRPVKVLPIEEIHNVIGMLGSYGQRKR